MKEIKLKGLDISAYTETLKNGLDVVFIPYADKKNYFMSYATRFGSEITSFTPAGEKKEITVPDGIAHFLEHKMFEQEDGVEPFAYFSESGTGANASTGYDNTQYICYGTKNFNDNLKYLLHYVNHPYYTVENVEKEKGIIAEELKMYEDIPDENLEIKLRQNIYHNHPRRVDIGGDIPSIQKITKEDLYTCYNNFYSPNNMFVLIVGNFNKEEAIEIIHQEMDAIENRGAPKIKKIREPKAIRVKEEKVYSTVKVPKIGIGIKVPIKDLGEYDELTLDLYLSMITTICFGSSSLFRERVRNQKLLHGFSMDWESTEDYKTFYILASTENPDQLIDEIKTELKDLTISEGSFSRMKKVWIANEVRLMDYVDAVVRNIFDDFIHYHRVVPDKIDQIRNLSLSTINEIAYQIDFKNMAVVQLLSKEQKKEK